MSEHKATIQWKRTTSDFQYATYSRDHQWRFENGITVNASAAPSYSGNPDYVDPEEAFVAALSSCHMLTFLAVAANKKYTIDEYHDNAVGYLEKNENGKMCVHRVELNPVVKFSGENIPDTEKTRTLHETAHQHCFIANSVNTNVIIKA